MKISNYFSLKEAKVTGKALPNEPTLAQVKVIEATAHRMDVFRELVGVPFTVNSWFRSKEVNTAVGGSKTSVHMTGRAVDFTTGKNMRDVYNIILNSTLSFDQCIYYPKKNFIHLGFCENFNKERKQTWEEK